MFGIPVDVESSLDLLEEHHAEALFALVDANRRYLRAWLPWLDQNTEAGHTRAFICRSREQLAAGNGWSCGLWHRGRLVGVVGLHFVDQANRRSSIGYWLDEGHQGKGLVTRACAALLDRLFGEMGLNLVEIACAVRNRRSRAIPERLHFKREGILRQREWLYDHYVDHVVYSMLATEWTRERQAGRRGRRTSPRGAPGS